MKVRKSQPYIIIMYIAGLFIIGLMYIILGKPLSMIYNTTYDDGAIYPISCYQEYANQSLPGENAQCRMYSGGRYLYNGSWSNPSRASDGDYSTVAALAGPNADMFIYYEKPNYNVNAATWLVKDGSTSTNFTIDIPIKCIYQRPNMLLKAHLDLAQSRNEYSCWNGTDYYSLLNVNAPTLNIYEEGIFWDENNEDKQIYQDFYTRTATIWKWILLFIALAMTLWFVIKSQERGPSDY